MLLQGSFTLQLLQVLKHVVSNIRQNNLFRCLNIVICKENAHFFVFYANVSNLPDCVCHPACLNIPNTVKHRLHVCLCCVTRCRVLAPLMAAVCQEAACSVSSQATVLIAAIRQLTARAHLAPPATAAGDTAVVMSRIRTSQYSLHQM